MFCLAECQWPCSSLPHLARGTTKHRHKAPPPTTTANHPPPTTTTHGQLLPRPRACDCLRGESAPSVCRGAGGPSSTKLCCSWQFASGSLVWQFAPFSRNLPGSLVEANCQRPNCQDLRSTLWAGEPPPAVSLAVCLDQTAREVSGKRTKLPDQTAKGFPVGIGSWHEMAK